MSTDAAVKTREAQEKKEILNKYRGLLRASQRNAGTKKDRQLIRQAFNTAMEAHKDVRRKSGEPYIFHPIAVARIIAEEMSLGATSIAAALLHDTVEDSDITLDDIQRDFGPKIRTIIDGLTKIPEVFDTQSTKQTENFKKIILTLSEDIRVIFVKLADRLHNMRTLDSMKKEKQLKIASETLYIYAPLAHRLGLYSIKSELEDLALKYKEPDAYEDLARKLRKTRDVRNRFINKFSYPIQQKLRELGFDFEIKGRTKSVYSIYNKIKKKGVPFEQIYDVFAIRIIIDSPVQREKSDCWKVYSVVTDFYKPNPDRLRDWISTPKANGYESLHTTVMSPTGKWVEVQIRTKRMDEVAEMGYAAHWKYKEADVGNPHKDSGNFEQWMNRIRELLKNPTSSALEFVDDIKLDLFADEIFVFTPKGELKTLPKGATALDLAFEIHTQVGEKCTGAKVNHKLVPLDHKLKSGDQIEVITARNQTPREDWLDYVITARARSKIKSALKKEKNKLAGDGKEILQRKLKHRKVHFSDHNLETLARFFELSSVTELYYRIAKGTIDTRKIRDLPVEGHNFVIPKKPSPSKAPPKKAQQKLRTDESSAKLILDDQFEEFDYKLAPCCNPIPGDDVFGFVTSGNGVKIHRVNCPNAIQLMSNHAERVIKARWTGEQQVEFLAGIRFSGIDDIGVVNKITNVISGEHHVNMNKISFESKAGIFEGEVMVYVHDTSHLDELMRKLQNINGVRSVERVETEEVAEE